MVLKSTARKKICDKTHLSFDHQKHFLAEFCSLGLSDSEYLKIKAMNTGFSHPFNYLLKNIG